MHILIDCSSLIYSSYFKYGIYNYRQEPIAIIYGFMKRIIEFSDKYQTNDFFFCFDSKTSLRKELFPEYKKSRKPKDKDEILLAKLRREQEVKIKKELRNIGFRNIFLINGYEADDLLSYWAKRLNKNTVMVTNDKDMYQNLDYCDIINPKDNKHYSKRKFEKEYKIKPSEWKKAKAIGGCLSDCIPGIKGVSDSKSTSSKALKYLNGNLAKGKVYNRIISEEGKKIIERNLLLVSCPYKNVDFRFKLKNNYVTKNKFMRFIMEYNFQKLLEYNWKNLIND